ncbi:MAG: hypothetical protein QM762_12845 [Chryseolinea sp.]
MLGSKEDAGRKQIQAAVGFTDWKAKIRGSEQAKFAINQIKTSLKVFDPYTEQKLKQLGGYWIYCDTVEATKTIPVTFKEWCKIQDP